MFIEINNYDDYSFINKVLINTNQIVSISEKKTIVVNNNRKLKYIRQIEMVNNSIYIIPEEDFDHIKKYLEIE